MSLRRPPNTVPCHALPVRPSAVWTVIVHSLSPLGGSWSVETSVPPAANWYQPLSCVRPGSGRPVALSMAAQPGPTLAARYGPAAGAAGARAPITSSPTLPVASRTVQSGWPSRMSRAVIVQPVGRTALVLVQVPT